MRLLIILSFIFAQTLIVNFAAAQMSNVKIVISDKITGRSLAGARVDVNSKFLAASDANGLATCILPEGTHQVVVTMLGYYNDTLAFRLPALNSEFAVQLLPANRIIDEVVVNTGYEKVPRERLTGAAFALGENVLGSMVSTSVIDRLENNVPGLIFNKSGQQPGNQTQISIRGQSTIFSRPDPLIVIDNFPYEGSLESINPDDIESVSVLKDAGAASVWGARAANGVIVLTTKKGRLSETINVDFNVLTTLSGKPDLYYKPIIPTVDYIQIERELFEKGFYDVDISDPNRPALTPVVELLLANGAGRIDNGQLESQLAGLSTRDLRRDMEDYVYRNQLNTHYSLGLNRSSDQSSWLLRLGFDDNQDNLVENGFQRFNSRFLIDQKLLKGKMRVSSELNFNWSGTDRPNTGQIKMSSFRDVYPYANLKNPDGSASSIIRDYRAPFIDSLLAQDLGLLDWNYRPLEDLALIESHQSLKELRANLSLSYELMKGVQIATYYQYANIAGETRNNKPLGSYEVRDMINSYSSLQDDGALSRAIPVGGILDLTKTANTSHRGRIQLSINRDLLTDLNLNSIIGSEVNNGWMSGSQVRFYGYSEEQASIVPVDYVNLYPQFINDVYNRQVPNYDNVMRTADRFVSYYQNSSLAFKSKYIITGSTRIDKSNIFGVDANQKGVPLWSLGGAWLMHKEAFAKNWGPNISNLKLRVTYGSNGNVNRSLSAYTTAQYFGVGPFNRLPFANVINPPNAMLRWEKTKVLNLGLDFTFFNGRLSGNFDYYKRQGIDLIGDTEYPSSSGVTRFRGNVASTKGSGFELLLASENLKGALGWQSVLMFSRAKDIVTKYSITTPISLSVLQSASLNPREGKPLHSMYSFAFEGLDPDTGDPVGLLEGMPSQDWSGILKNTAFEDLIFHGSSRPQWLATLRNTWRFRSWALSTNVSYRGDYYYRRNSVNYISNGRMDNGLGSNHADYLLRWQKPGDELRTNVPSIPQTLNVNRENYYRLSETLVERGDHIRWEDLSIISEYFGKKRKMS